MKKQTTLESLYNFIAANYDKLQSEYKTKVKDKKTLPFVLFCVALYSEIK